MNNFSAHELGVEQIKEKRELTNTRVNISLYLETLAYSSQIMWLSLNTTSEYQPLDQGIIAN